MAEVLTAAAEFAATLAAGFRGRLIGPDDADYDRARKLFNAMIDKRPRLIAQCVDAADVIAAVMQGATQGSTSPFVAGDTTDRG